MHILTLSLKKLVDYDTSVLERIEDIFAKYRIPEYYKKNFRFRRVNGCDQCYSGVKGLTVASETLKPTPEILEAIAGNKQLEAFILWRRLGEITAKEDAILKTIEGKVCPTSIEIKLGSYNDIGSKKR